MLTLNSLYSPKGAHKNIKRIGRGQGSGQGTQAGKGHKGQKARAGGGVRAGFEGGSMPLYMRIPKRRLFTNAPFKKIYSIVSLDSIAEKFNTNESVDRDSLIAKGMLKGAQKRLPIKILIKKVEQIDKVLVFSGINNFSKKAQELVAKAGGTINS